MKYLHEIRFILGKGRSRFFNILPELYRKDTKLLDFYQRLNSFHSDEEAAAYFYDAPPSDGRYKKLKSRLKNRMIDALFFIDLEKKRSSHLGNVYNDCWKEWAAIKILIGRGGRSSSVKLCRALFRKAKKHQFLDLLVFICKHLSLHYGLWENNPREYQCWKEKFQFYTEAYAAEEKVEHTYLELLQTYAQKELDKKTFAVSARKAMEDIRPFLEAHPYHKIIYLGNAVQLIQLMSENRYEEAVDVCDVCLRYFTTKRYPYRAPILMFSYQKLLCHTQLRQFEKGQETIQKCRPYIAEGSGVWYRHQELSVHLCLHTKQYQKGYDQYRKAITHSSFDFLDKDSREAWILLGGYLHFLAKLQLVVPEKKDDAISHFRVHKFLNELPRFSQDKRGRNVPILILQLLHFIQASSWDLALNRMDSLKKYTQRYLKDETLIRSSYFIKSLLKLGEFGFQPKSAGAHARKYLDKLSAHPLQLHEQIYEMEIIPYEELWELILQSLSSGNVSRQR